MPILDEFIARPPRACSSFNSILFTRPKKPGTTRSVFCPIAPAEEAPPVTSLLTLGPRNECSEILAPIKKATTSEIKNSAVAAVRLGKGIGI
jgi:hypothetical protein